MTSAQAGDRRSESVMSCRATLPHSLQPRIGHLASALLLYPAVVDGRAPTTVRGAARVSRPPDDLRGLSDRPAAGLGRRDMTSPSSAQRSAWSATGPRRPSPSTASPT